MSSPNPNDLTRHQLDELDALLQRMLSLPLGGPGSEPPAAPRPTPATAVTLPPFPEVPAVPPAPLAHWNAAAESRPANFVVPTLPSLSPRIEVEVEVEAEPEPEPPMSFGPPRLAEVSADEETPVEPPSEPRTLRGVDAPAMPLGYRPPPIEVPAEASAEDDEVVLTPAPVLGLSVPAAAVPASAAMFAPPPAGGAVTVPSALKPVYALNAAVEFALDLTGPFSKLFTNRVSKQVLGWSGVALVLLAAVWAARGAGLVDFPLPPGVESLASR